MAEDAKQSLQSNFSNLFDQLTTKRSSDIGPEDSLNWFSLKQNPQSTWQKVGMDTRWSGMISLFDKNKSTMGANIAC